MDLIRRAGDNVNLVVYDNIQPIVWATTIPFFVICLTSCIIRLYTRAFIQKPFGVDDWFMVGGSVSVLFGICNNIWLTRGQILWIGQQYIAWMWTILGGGL
jgi:hypothetical protein